MLLVEDHLNLLSVQYLVHCLDTENVCHHITKLDHPPREMKETLFTRHNQTVLPLLANTKRASLQAVHTSFANTAIDNMMDNRVLSYRPPPIIDEEIYLTRRQWPTLSQLRSGQCKLLNSYKKRLKQTDSSSCADCGMDLQDVPHLFNCTAHPTTLTPKSLWDRPVKTIRELSFLDPENLNLGRGWLKRAYNNNMSVSFKSEFNFRFAVKCICNHVNYHRFLVIKDWD